MLRWPWKDNNWYAKNILTVSYDIVFYRIIYVRESHLMNIQCSGLWYLIIIPKRRTKIQHAHGKSNCYSCFERRKWKVHVNLLLLRTQDKTTTACCKLDLIFIRNWYKVLHVRASIRMFKNPYNSPFKYW